MLTSPARRGAVSWDVFFHARDLTELHGREELVDGQQQSPSLCTTWLSLTEIPSTWAGGRLE